MKKFLVCNGINLFYFENNVFIINKSVFYLEYNIFDLYEFKIRNGKIDDKLILRVCEIRGIERVIDSFYIYIEGIVKENGLFNMFIKYDFVYVKCFLNLIYNFIYVEDNEVEDYFSNDSLYSNDDFMEYKGSIFNEYFVDFD